MSKTLKTLVKDVYDFLEHGEINAEALAKDIALSLAEKVGKTRKPSLSMSQLGKPSRLLWYSIKEPVKVSGKDRLKFLYGDIIEAVVLHLVKASGHSVTDQQKQIEVDGVKGSIDAIVDGALVDVKSASPTTFNKFSTGLDIHNDSFGYLAQINGYNEALKKDEVAFLVVNKVTGELLVSYVDSDFDFVDVKELIKKQKRCLKNKKNTAERCYTPVPHGESGNEVLPKDCTYCPYKFKCWDNLKAVEYSTGTKYFTKIVKQPRVRRKSK